MVVLIEDPAGGPTGVAPYAVLAGAGVTPWTGQGDMQDVSFELQARRLMSPQTQQAWNDLRSTRRRLLFDLFLYDVGDGPEEPGEAVGPGGPPPAWAARLLDDLIRFDR